MYKIVFLFFCVISSIISANPSSKNVHFPHPSVWTPIDISLDQATVVAEKIQRNEMTLNRDDLLTFWNAKEPFPSMGIGHFIWPPKSYKGPFSKGRFHKVVQFIHSKNIDVPQWLLEARYCPWETRDLFYQQFSSQKMQELRSFLQKTKPYQAMYMVERLNKIARKFHNSSDEKKRGVISNFHRVAKTPHGIYILIDYLNFKGEGTDPKERYKGQGWGLLQVLQKMDPKNPDPHQAFADAAQYMLERRIKNSSNPQDKNWLPGWTKRINTYR